jgi:hypothetical protein
VEVGVDLHDVVGHPGGADHRVTPGPGDVDRVGVVIDLDLVMDMADTGQPAAASAAASRCPPYLNPGWRLPPERPAAGTQGARQGGRYASGWRATRVMTQITGA